MNILFVIFVVLSQSYFISSVFEPYLEGSRTGYGAVEFIRIVNFPWKNHDQCAGRKSMSVSLIGKQYYHVFYGNTTLISDYTSYCHGNHYDYVYISWDKYAETVVCITPEHHIINRTCLITTKFDGSDVISSYSVIYNVDPY